MHNSWPVTLKSWIVTQRCRICRQSVITWLLILTPLHWYIRAKRQSEDKTSKCHLLGGAELGSQDLLINVFTSRWQCKVRNDFILSLDVICAAEWMNHTSRSLSGVSFCYYKRSEPFLMFQHKSSKSHSHKVIQYCLETPNQGRRKKKSKKLLQKFCK